MDVEQQLPIVNDMCIWVKPYGPFVDGNHQWEYDRTKMQEYNTSLETEPLSQHVIPALSSMCDRQLQHDDFKLDLLGRNMVFRSEAYYDAMQALIVRQQHQRQRTYPQSHAPNTLVMQCVARAVQEFAWISPELIGFVSVMRWHIHPELVPSSFYQTPFSKHFGCFFGACRHIWTVPALHQKYCIHGKYAFYQPMREMTFRYLHLLYMPRLKRENATVTDENPSPEKKRKV